MVMAATHGVLRSVDLFCGAGGIAEGFRQGGFKCLYGNDIDVDAMATFHENHVEALADLARGIA